MEEKGNATEQPAAKKPKLENGLVKHTATPNISSEPNLKPHVNGDVLNNKSKSTPATPAGPVQAAAWCLTLVSLLNYIISSFTLFLSFSFKST